MAEACWTGVHVTLPELPWAGGCRCGKLRFSISEAPLLTSVCHCRGCQRMSGSAYSLTLSVPGSGFAVTHGEGVIGGAHSSGIRHNHCDYCKSWVYTVVEPDMGFVNVRATLLDDPSWFEPFLETQAAERLPWVTVPAARRYDRFPAMDEFIALTREFRTENGLG